MKTLSDRKAIGSELMTLISAAVKYIDEADREPKPPLSQKELKK